MRQDWFHFILDKLGRSFTEDSNGNVITTSSATPLEHTADGWKEISVGLERDKKRWGLLFNFGFPLKFPLEAGKILRDQFYKLGRRVELFYLISYRIVTFEGPVFKDYYTKFFRGQFDMTKFKDKEDHVVCTIGSLGLEKALKAKENEVYEFPLSDLEASIIKMDGMKIYSTTTFHAPKETPIDNGVFDDHVILPFGVSVKEGETVGVGVFDQVIGSVTGTPTTFFQNSTNYHLAVDVVTVPINMRYKGKLVVKIKTLGIILSPSTHPRLEISLQSNFGPRIIPQGGVIAGTILADFLVPSTLSTPITITIPVDVANYVTPGEHMFLVGRIYNNGTNVQVVYEFLEDSNVDVFFGNRATESYIRSFAPAVLLDKIIEKIYGQRGKTFSVLLTTPPVKNFYITSGDGLRGLPNAVVKISYNKFFDIYRVNGFAGHYINDNTLFIEVLTRFFNPEPLTAPIDLGEAKKFEVGVPEDLTFNSVEIGHTDRDIEGVNGKLRFNTVHQYSTPDISNPNKFSLISPAIADPFIIEHTRINFTGKKTTDSSEDNDLFLIVGEDDTISSLRATAIISVSENFPSGSNLSFQEFNNIGLAPDGNLEQFTWVGPGSIPASIDFYGVPVSTPTADQNVTIELYVENVLKDSQTVVGNGNNPIQLSFATNLIPGDTITFKIISANGQPIEMLNANMGIQLTNLPIVKLYRRPYDVLEGVMDDTVFNIEFITPARLMELWAPFLNSLFYKFAGEKFKYETSDRNPELKTVRLGVTYDEDSDKAIGSFIYFKPITFDVESEPIDFVKYGALQENQLLPFQTTYEGNIYKGYLLKGGFAPEENKSQVFQLLCTQDTDETKLIRK